MKETRKDVTPTVSVSHQVKPRCVVPAGRGGLCCLCTLSAQTKLIISVILFFFFFFNLGLQNLKCFCLKFRYNIKTSKFSAKLVLASYQDFLLCLWLSLSGFTVSV